MTNLNHTDTSVAPSMDTSDKSASPDPTLPTPEEEKQFIAQGKEETEQLDPEANAIEKEFDSYPNPSSTPVKGNKGVSFQSTLTAWTLVTPRDKMKKLRKVKAQAKNAKAAQDAEKAKKALDKQASQKESPESSAPKTTEEKATYAEKALATSAAAKDTTSDTNEEAKVVENSSSSEDNNSTPPSKSSPTKQRPNISRPFSTYYTLKLKVKASKNSVKELVSKAKVLFKALREVDGSLVIYSYKEDVPSKAIINEDDIPDNINKLKEFFSGANPTPKAGHVWASLWIGHSEETENLHSSFKYWSMENDTFLYKKKLQEKQTVRNYFLLYSTDKVDVETLHAAVTAEIKKISTREYKFAFVWTVIKSKGRYVTTESTENKGNQYVKALHVEVPRQEHDATYRMLLRFFGSTSKQKILHRNLRMIPVITADTPTHKKTKISHLIEKQKRFVNNISTAISYDLSDIDYLDPMINMTMRSIIMDIETIEKPKTLFLGIDYSEYSSGYVITFPTYLESEARDCIAQLPSFLHWLYGDPILQLLTDSAVERAYEAPWSEELMRAVSKEDTALDSLLDEANQVDWLRNEDEVIIEIPPEKNAASAFLFDRACDNDSVSTFRTKKSRPPTNDSPSKKTKTDKNQDVDMTNVTPSPEKTAVPDTPMTPKMNTISQLDTPLINTNKSSNQTGHPVTPPVTDNLGSSLQTRHASKKDVEPSDNSSESSEVSL